MQHLLGILRYAQTAVTLATVPVVSPIHTKKLFLIILQIEQH